MRDGSAAHRLTRHANPVLLLDDGLHRLGLEYHKPEVPKRGPEFCDTVTDNFRVVDPKDLRFLA